MFSRKICPTTPKTSAQIGFGFNLIFIREKLVPGEYRTIFVRTVQCDGALDRAVATTQWAGRNPPTELLVFTGAVK